MINIRILSFTTQTLSFAGAVGSTLATTVSEEETTNTTIRPTTHEQGKPLIESFRNISST